MKKKPKKRHNRDKLSGLKKALSRLDVFSVSFMDTLAKLAAKQFIEAVSGEIAKSGENARLHNFDEQAYTAYAALLEHYRGITTLYEQNVGNITDEQMREMVAGIVSVITSRLNLADEHEDWGLTHENPITCEKNRLIEAAMQEFLSKFELTTQDTLEAKIFTLRPRLKLLLLQTPYAAEPIHSVASEIADVANGLTSQLYQAYCKASQALTAQLDDMDKRSVTSYYLSILEDERDILESIAKIQLEAIDCAAGVSSGSHTAVDELLSAIRECYLLFMADANPILSRLHHPHEQVEQWAAQIHSFDGFRSALAAKLCFPPEVYEQAEAELAELLGTFDRELAKVTSSLVEKKVGKTIFGHTLQELNANIAKPLLMADEMSAIFRRANKFYLEHEQALLAELGVEIISGINETIDIKVMSIADGELAFSEETQTKLLQFLSDRQSNCETIADNIRSEVGNKLLEALLDGKTYSVADALETAFDNALEQCGFTAKAAKTVQSWQAEIGKLILAFKRDVLLYEIGTFDEIMNFSVGKLIGDAGENPNPSPTLAYTTHLQQAQHELVEMLARNDITQVIPPPHTPFNAKEHDVLTAEPTEGFAKGEVVKTFSSGYKERDVVLVRAGVIAAK